MGVRIEGQDFSPRCEMLYSLRLARTLEGPWSIAGLHGRGDRRIEVCYRLVGCGVFSGHFISRATIYLD